MFGKAPCTLGLVAGLVAPAIADSSAIDQILNDHVLPGYRLLVRDTARLAETSAEQCTPANSVLRDRYHAAFDAWVRVSHLRFGPSEVQDRAFAMAFWPDTRGKTPKTLRKLIETSNPVVETADEFRTLSIAGRGFHALEFMLYDPTFGELGDPDYRCALIRAMTADIAEISAAILADWEDGYADVMRTAGSNETYRTQDEALKQVFTALSTGLQFTSELRLGRPLGTIERPRPRRSEARRSGRSLRNVVLSLETSRELAALLAGNDPALDSAFLAALDRAEHVDDPVFAGVSDPQKRLKVEVLQQSVDRIRQILVEEIGSRLGFSAGFNALDGD